MKNIQNDKNTRDSSTFQSIHGKLYVKVEYILDNADSMDAVKTYFHAFQRDLSEKKQERFTWLEMDEINFFTIVHAIGIS